MSEPKIYVRGSAREVEFSNGGSLVNFSIDLNDPVLRQHAKEGKNGALWVQLTQSKKREIDQYKNSHATYINTYEKPEEAVSTNTGAGEPDLPF